MHSFVSSRGRGKFVLSVGRTSSTSSPSPVSCSLKHSPSCWFLALFTLCLFSFGFMPLPISHAGLREAGETIINICPFHTKAVAWFVLMNCAVCRRREYLRDQGSGRGSAVRIYLPVIG